MKHFSQIFPNVSEKVLNSIARDRKWALDMCAKGLVDTKQAASNFLLAFTHVMKFIGRVNCERGAGPDLYKFVQTHAARDVYAQSMRKLMERKNAKKAERRAATPVAQGQNAG